MKKSPNKSAQPEPKDNCTISVIMPIWLKAKLKKSAKMNSRDMSKQVRFFVEEGVKHLED